MLFPRIVELVPALDSTTLVSVLKKVPTKYLISKIL